MRHGTHSPAAGSKAHIDYFASVVADRKQQDARAPRSTRHSADMRRRRRDSQWADRGAPAAVVVPEASHSASRRRALAAALGVRAAMTCASIRNRRQAEVGVRAEVLRELEREVGVGAVSEEAFLVEQWEDTGRRPAPVEEGETRCIVVVRR